MINTISDSSYFKRKRDDLGEEELRAAQKIPHIPLKQLQNQEISLRQAVVCREFANKAIDVYNALQKESGARVEACQSKKRRKICTTESWQYADDHARASRLQRGVNGKIKEFLEYDGFDRSSAKSAPDPYFT